ncbi:hypothetical protein GBAR_LOCUS10032, partial [Geodia barretti]
MNLQWLLRLLLPSYVEPNEKDCDSCRDSISTPSVIVSWHHGTVAYHQHIREDPFVMRAAVVKRYSASILQGSGVTCSHIRNTRRIITECVLVHHS